MCAAGGALDGSDAALEELVDFLVEELEAGLAPAGDRRPLLSIMRKIDPQSSEWLGV